MLTDLFDINSTTLKYLEISSLKNLVLVNSKTHFLIIKQSYFKRLVATIKNKNIAYGFGWLDIIKLFYNIINTIVI